MRIALAIALGIGTTVSTIGLAASSVTLIQDSKAKVAIYVEPEAMAADTNVQVLSESRQMPEMQRRRLRDSVQDLAAYLGKMSGATVGVFPREPAKEDGTLPILIGAYAEKALGPPGQKSPYQQGWRMVVSKKGVGLMGESDEARSCAIYEMLDRLGCRWYLPSDMGECIPSLPTISLPVSDVSGVPSIVNREIWYADDAYKRRNRLGGIHLRASQGMEGYLTPKQLAEHPDWNAEFGGKRAIGTCKVIVNGAPIAYVNAKGETLPEANGYCEPFSFDITSAVKPGENQIAIRAEHQGLNELGTGGIMGPVLVYQEK